MLTVRFISNLNYNYNCKIIKIILLQLSSSIQVCVNKNINLTLKFTNSKSCHEERTTKRNTVTSLLVLFSKSFGSQNLRDQIPKTRQLCFPTFDLLHHCSLSFDAQNHPFIHGTIPVIMLPVSC